MNHLGQFVKVPASNTADVSGKKKKDSGVGWNIILKWNLEKWDELVRTGLIWHEEQWLIQ
jgi:long-subunit fatty acid transport protein